MKKIVTAAICCALLLLLPSCASIPPKKHITWPDKIKYVEALCELDMSWRDMKYSGQMSVKMRYPDGLHIEVYGPFGETVVYLRKDADTFSFVSKDERFSDEKRFEERFGIRLREFIDDLALEGPIESGAGQVAYLRRKNYAVIYELDGRQDRICWKGADGSICVRFLEAAFEEEKSAVKR